MVDANGHTRPEDSDIPLAAHIGEKEDWTCADCGYVAEGDDIMVSIYDDLADDPEDPDNYSLLCKECNQDLQEDMRQARREAQLEANKQEFSRNEKHEGQLRALFGLFAPFIYTLSTPFTAVYFIYTGRPQQWASEGVVELAFHMLFTLEMIPGGFVAFYLVLVVGSWVEPHNGWFTRLRSFIGGKLSTVYKFMKK